MITFVDVNTDINSTKNEGREIFMEVIMVILPLILIGFIYFIPSYIASKKISITKF